MKTKRFLAIVLAIAVLASFISVPVFAEGEGETLEALGILMGTGDDGVTEEYLDSLAMRTQAAMINLRLLGHAADALAFDGDETFADAADATEYWQPVLEYLKATPGMGWVGDEDDNFLPNDYITGQAFTKILLVALGYEYELDFDWETTMDFAAETGLTVLADKAGDDLTVRDISAAIIEALGLKFNSDTDVTLLTQLVLDGVIDEAAAVAAGFEIEDPSFKIINAYASAVNEATIVMSTDVPEDAVVTLKKGTASYNVTKAIDGSTITLTALFNLPAGTYTVTVDEETADFEVLSQYAVDLVIGAESVYLADGQDLKVSLLDQYGDAMSLTGTNYSVFNQSDGYVYSPAVTTTLKIDVTDDTVGDGVKAGHIIYVFVYDPASMLTVSGELPVIAAPYLETLAVGGVTDFGKVGDTVQTDLFEGATGVVLDVKAYDQYGQAMTLTNDMFTTTVPYDYTAEVQILSSNGTAIDPASITVVDGVFKFATGGAGTAVLTFIIPDQANIYTTEAMTVLGTPTLDTVEIAGPDEAVYAGEEEKFPVAGFDQYGAPIDVAAGALTFTQTVDLFTGNPVDVSATNEVSFTADAGGSSTVYYFLGGVFQGTFDVTANAEAYPFQIVGVTAPGGLEEGASDIILSADIEVIDQFGRSYTTRKVNPFTGGWDFEVVSKAALVKFNLTDEGPGNGFTISSAAIGLDTGAETFIAQLTDGGVAQGVSKLEFTMTYVESEDIVSYSADVIDDVLYAGDLDWDTYGQMFIYNDYTTDSSYYPYDNPIIYKGYLADGMEVALKCNDGIPAIFDIITYSTDTHFDFDFDTRTDYLGKPTVYGTITEAALIVMKVWVDGEMVASDEFEAATDDYTVTSIEATDAVLDWSKVVDLNDVKGFWPPEVYTFEDEWIASMESIFNDSGAIPWHLQYLAMNTFTIMDQYDVELFWLPLMEEGMIKLYATSEIKGDDTYYYFTLMTPNGIVYDTLTVADDSLPIQ